MVLNYLKENVLLIAGKDTWIEGESTRQLIETTKLDGMINSVGFPDIQPGKGSPSGATFLSKNVHPSLVGTDIGCGMSLTSTTYPVKKIKIDKICKNMNELDQPYDDKVIQDIIKNSNLDSTPYDHSLGTPGRGNHFIELQTIDSIVNKSMFDNLSIDADMVQILVHSGSRGYGESIFNDTVRKHGDKPLESLSEFSSEYLNLHDKACKWAIANRNLCTYRVEEILDTKGTNILNITHNSVSPFIHNGCNCFLHRKGSAPSNKGPIIIPGSRGDLSALVIPLESDLALNSLAHGAGRKFSRLNAKEKLASKYKKGDLKQNKWGGRIICGEEQLTWEEAPECYKSLESVINDLLEAKLIEVIAYLRPIITFKTNEGARQERESEKKNWQTDRRESRRHKENR
jgi:release factor H-coupled RctB family protein